jgi:hypothetical protein
MNNRGSFIFCNERLKAEKEEEERKARMRSIANSGESERKPKQMNQEGKEVKKTYDATTFDDIPDLE